MGNHMKARFWWAIRNWWHYPQFWHMGQKSPLYRGLYVRWKIKDRRYKSLLIHLYRDTRYGIWRLYWYLRYLQPLRCNGDKGGWRTKVCDWLEDKARSYEDVL